MYSEPPRNFVGCMVQSAVTYVGIFLLKVIYFAAKQTHLGKRIILIHEYLTEKFKCINQST